jgi:hypothetical protein
MSISAGAGEGLPIGTYEQALAMVGTQSQPRRAEGPVNVAMIRCFCASTEDANPGYWDDAFAKQQWGAIISPPAMLVHWLFPPPWRPGQPTGGSLAPEVLGTLVPLPGDTVINVSVDYEYRRQIRVGDHLAMVEELIAVSPEKTTWLGRGHFVTTLATYRDQHDKIVATETNTLFRYTRAADA